MINRRVPLSALCALLCFLGFGCGGGSSSQPPGGNGGGVGVTPNGLQFTTPTTPQTFELGQANSISLRVSQPVTWSLESSCPKAKPAGMLTAETSTTATYNGPTQMVSCPYNVSNLADTVVATSQADPTQSTTLSVLIVQTNPSISNVSGLTSFTTCPPSGTVLMNPGTIAGSTLVPVTLTATGGVSPYTWQVLSGALPPGLSLAPGSDTSKMIVQGTPVSPGCSTIQLQVTDSKGVTGTVTGASSGFAVVTAPPRLKIQVPSYPIAYNQTLQAGDPGVPYVPTALVAFSGVGPYTWTPDTTMTLPPGMNFSFPPANSSVAIIAGTPASGAESGNTFGQYPTLINVNDSQLPYPATASATLPNMGAASLSQFCSAAQPLPPSSTNGGVASGGSVPGSSFLQGTFAFLLRGSDANGPVVIAGSVVLDGKGNVTSGVEDVNRSSGSQSFTIDPNNSNYTVGINASRPIGAGGTVSLYNRGCLNLSNSGGMTTALAVSLSGCSNNFAESGVINSYKDACGLTQSNGLNIAAGTYTSGRIIEFDDNTGSGTRAAGILRMQDTSSFSAGLSGRYAFGLAGWNVNKGRYAMAGSVQASGGNLSSAAADIDDAGTLGSQLTGGSGSYVLAGSNGRGTATLKIGQASFDLAFYMVSKNELFLLTTDPLSASQPVIAGEAVPTASSFNNSMLQSSHMFHIGGLAATGPDVTIGVLNFDGIGALTGTSYGDQAGTTSTVSLSGAFAVDPVTGRTALTAPSLGQNLGAHPFVAYIAPPAPGLSRISCSRPATCITGFLVGTDNTSQDGILEFQISTTAPPPPFTNRYIAGDYVYGNDENLDPPSTSNMSVNLTGSVFANPSPTSVTGGGLGGSSQTPPFFQDVSYGDPNYCGSQSCLLLLPSQALSGAYSITSNGTGSFGGGTVSVSNGNIVFYIDESPLNLHPSVIVAEQ